MTTTMTIDEAVKIASELPGWCQIDELYWLGQQASQHHTIVEIGSWQGRSCKVMALMTPGTVYAVDDWRGAGGAESNGMWHDGFPMGHDFTPHEELEQRFRNNLADEIEAGKVVVIDVPSPAAVLFAPPQMDMVYIDGDHDIYSVRQDIQAWRHVLDSGGLLCGHDGNDPRVKKALKLEGIDFEIVTTSVWRSIFGGES